MRYGTIPRCAGALGVVALACASASVQNASAAVVNLTAGDLTVTTSSGSTGVLVTKDVDGSVTIDNGAIFKLASVSGGTGIFAPFVRIREGAVEQGYNTDASPPPPDAVAGPWTHAIQFGQIPQVDGYLRFELGINEPGQGKEYLSLDKVQIYAVPGNASFSGDINTLSGLKYSMNSMSTNVVFLDSTLNQGNSDSNMTLFVPVSNFSGVANSDYIYLYSHFGGVAASGSGYTVMSESKDVTSGFAAEDGFEEWRVIPEPGTIAVLGLACMSLLRRKKNRP